MMQELEAGQNLWGTIKSRATGERIPLAGGFSLTSRCNLACRHCYVGAQRFENKRYDQKTQVWLNLIDQVADNGCLHLVLTGGEPFLHAGFPDIYRYARQKGLIVEIFSNATLVSDSILSCLEESPPLSVEISLYGATEKTFERVTCEKGSFAACMAGIERLTKKNIRIKLKTVLLNLNVDEISQMETFAKSIDVPFRFTGAIVPTLDRCDAPKKLRVLPEEVVNIDFADAERRQAWLKYRKEHQREIKSGESLFTCGGGRTNFHITSDLRLQPCVMAQNPSVNLKDTSFQRAWGILGIKLCELKKDEGHSCSGCTLSALCGVCPPVAYLESGMESGKSDFACSLGHLREDQLKLLSEQENAS